MRKIGIIILLVASLGMGAFYLSGQTPSPAEAQNNGMVRVRFVHAVPEVAAIDVYVDGARVVSNLALGEASPHLQTPSRAATVSIRPAGAAFTTAPIASRELNLVTTSGGFGHVSVVFQLDGFAQPTISTVEDLLAPTRTDGARLHVIHAVPDGPAIGIQTDQGAGFLSGAMFNTQVPTVDPADRGV